MRRDVTTLSLYDSDLQRVESLRRLIERETGPAVSRSTVLRAAISLGAAALETDFARDVRRVIHMSTK